MRLPRALDRSVAAVIGAIVGAVLVLSVDALTHQPRSDRSPEPSFPSAASPRPVRSGRYVPDRTAVLAWAPGGLPRGAEEAVERARSVVSATTVVSGQDWITETRGADGAIVDRTRSGFAIPVEVAVVEPREYARFVPPSDRDLIHALRGSQVLLSRTAARLRGAEPGMEISFVDRDVSVAGVVSDAAANGYELLITGPVPPSWSVRYPFVIAETKGGRSDAIEKRVAPLLEPGTRLRVRAERETPFLRYGDAVLPQMLIKDTFGEFSARPRPDGGIDIDPAWDERNIQRVSVPILGTVACHRAVVPQLRAALQEVRERGLAFTIDPNDYGGCFSPRFINADPDARISHHAYGIAIDINVSENAFGTRPDIDPRLVDVFTKWGFAWGGDWLLPDGMHFEWIAFP